MCGIGGFWGSAGRSSDSAAIAEAMVCQLEHRGPDSGGVWVDDEQNVALGHRRLAIVDLSPDGHQPMASARGRYAIAFNGEIFNFEAIRDRVTAGAGDVVFRGHSDTEVLLAAIEQWGLERTLQELIGMFAFALWDRRERTLTLARDRLGKKPLYYGWTDSSFLFASELKAIRAHPEFRGRIDRTAVAAYLRYSYVPAPRSIYEGYAKLPPGTTLTLRSPTDRSGTPGAYWSASQVAMAGRSAPYRGSMADATDELNALLLDAVRLRMIADVPIGAFLSGGIDSSLVVALMQASSPHPVHTFSIGTPDQRTDESRYAEQVAAHLGTNHTTAIVTERDALQIIPHLPAIYDEPFADSSQIPSYLVSSIARRHVTVALSGDGGDELFGGYNRHLWAPRFARLLATVPRPLRRGLAAAIVGVSPQRWDAIADFVAPVLPRGLAHVSPGFKAHKLAASLHASDGAAFYDSLRSQWERPEQVLRGIGPDAGRHSIDPTMPDFASEMMYQDLVTYLPDDILTKVDRSSMAVALEARVPLLDHRVVEFAWRLPPEAKIRKGVGKWILREVLHRYVPRELVDRPKAGFGIPLAAWLRGPLREWGESLLSAEAIDRHGLLDSGPVRALWNEHLGTRRDHGHRLWTILMLQAWLEEQASASARPTLVHRLGTSGHERSGTLPSAR